MKYFNFKLLSLLFALAMAIPPAWATTTDVITASDLPATSDTQAYFTGVSKPSGAVYAGRTGMSSKGAILITKVDSNSGIVSTTSGGKAKSVTIIFNVNTDKRNIYVYGKNTPYTGSADLSDASLRGDQLGVTNNATNVVTINGDYEYIGITSTGSSNNALIDEVQIEWEGGNTPSIAIDPESLTINDGAAGTFTITGTNIEGNINASLATTADWTLSPEAFSNTGGEANVTYTGRALSATNTLNATAASGNTVTAVATVNYLADLYIVTDNGVTGQWDFSNGTPMTYSDGTYTATFTATADNTFILFARKLGEANPWNTRYVFGPNSNGDWEWGTYTSGTLDLNDDDPIKLPAGNYTVTINANYGTFAITKVLEQVATPTFSPAEGTYSEAQTVTIACVTDGATISYSTDGGTTWSNYNGAIAVSETTTITAKATKDGMTDSETATATYTISQPSSSTEVTIADGTDQAEFVPVYGYQYDANSQHNQIVYPASELSQLKDGDIINGITFYPTTATLPFSGGSVTLSMANMTQGTTISWSIDPWGSASGDLFDNAVTPVATITAPTATDGLWIITFTTPFTYTGGDLLIDVTTAKGTYGYSYFNGKNMSSIYGLATYESYSGTSKKASTILPKATFAIQTSVQEQVAMPTFSPEAGTYTSAQTVTITTATDGATIYYTTDGSTPTTSSTQYAGAITVSETTTIRAIAVKADMADSEVATATYTIEIPVDYAVTVAPNGGNIAFGTANPEQGESVTRTITVTNTGLQPVTPTLSALTAPFSTDYTPTELASGESVTITITFAPTAEGNFTGEATLSFGNGIDNVSFTLNGKGGTIDENDHSALYDYNYDWTDDNGESHTSNLLETATDPNQIIAMLRKIYMTREIPGNKLRGYTADGQPESLIINDNDAFQVNYSAVGQLNSSLQYTDTYGWNIPTEKPVRSLTKGNYTYNYMDPTEYEPEQEGLTLIMIEIKDGANYSGSDYHSFTNATLKEKVANTFKSARIITTYKKSGSDEAAGTLFKIDADKLNRFFFLAKGQLRIIDHSQAGEKPWTSTTVVPFPSMKVRGSSYTFTDNTFNATASSAVLAPFEHMFEQFSPNQASSSTDAMTDVYQDLVNMESYQVVHDCVSIPFVGGNHEFNMYGVESTSDDCQDVRDMMFFVPDYRMKYWAETQYSFGDATRDPSNDEKFVNYNRDHRPTLGLYVIRQNEITGEQQAGADVYDLHLSWESNLLNFLPSDEAEYNLYRVETDDDGNKNYIFVATIAPGETTYTDQVPMQENGQQVTYVVQGQDTEHFLSLQMSNEESYIIPGTDKSEIITLSPKTDDYSRFDPLTERNYYANQLKLTNNVGTNVKGSYLGNGAKLTFYRTPSYGATTGEKVPVFVATSDGNGTLTITAQNQREGGLYNEWINMVNPSTVTYTVDGNDNVTFNNFNLYDNFYESVASNNHPSLYIYEVELQASTTIADTQGNMAHSNQIGVFVHKTDMDVLGYSKEQIDADTDHALATGVRYIDEEVKYSSKTEILRYDNYRWNQENENLGVIIDWANSKRDAATGGVSLETDIEPTGQAGNQATEYTVKMDGVNSGSISIGQGQTRRVTYEDKVVENQWGMYTYAPVVETFTSRSDYNTYGAPLQQTGVATCKAKVADAIMSSKSKGGSNWTEDGKVYTHYTVTLDLSELLIPTSENDALKDYDLYMVRAWRQVDPQLLKEQVFTGTQRQGLNREDRATASGEFMMEEVDYNVISRDMVNNALGSSQYKLGSNEDLLAFNSKWTMSGTDEVSGTFGAQKLAETDGEAGCITQLPLSFIVRAYYTRKANIPQTLSANANRGIDTAADQKYYIAEYTFDYTLTGNNIVTGLGSVVTDRQVTDVTYYNLMGQQASKPFQGVNIIVTHYSDGTTTTAKVLK